MDNHKRKMKVLLVLICGLLLILLVLALSHAKGNAERTKKMEGKL